MQRQEGLNFNMTQFQHHFNIISTSFQHHFNIISTHINTIQLAANGLHHFRQPSNFFTKNLLPW